MTEGVSVAQLSDSDQIRNVIAAYAHAADVHDARGMAACFGPDGVLVEYEAPVPSSRIVELVEYFNSFVQSLPQPRGARHIQANTFFHELTDTSARTTTDLLLADLDPERGWHVGGTGQYLDEFTKIDGRWYFQRREVRWFKDLGRNPLETNPKVAELFRAFAAGTHKQPAASG
jgi:SnoaL-like domain